MVTPIKPWEAVTRNQLLQDRSSLMPDRAVVRHAAPPLPPRNSRGAMPSAMSRFMFNQPSFGYGGFGPYGGYGSPYATRGMEFENRYVQIAEESAQPAFESIDNFVRGFSSVTMMLESTYQAMYMSFRAVLGVAENMSRMKGALLEFLSAFAVLNTIHKFYRKVLYYLGLVRGTEMSWQEAERAVNPTKPANKPHWPLIAFFTAIIAGPMLMYKYLLPESVTEDDNVELVGVFDFESDHPGELSFKKGEFLSAKRSAVKRGWIMAKKGNKTGYVPFNRVNVVKRVTRVPGSTSVTGGNNIPGHLEVTCSPVPDVLRTDRIPANVTGGLLSQALGGNAGSQQTSQFQTVPNKAAVNASTVSQPVSEGACPQGCWQSQRTTGGITANGPTCFQPVGTNPVPQTLPDSSAIDLSAACQPAGSANGNVPVVSQLVTSIPEPQKSNSPVDNVPDVFQSSSSNHEPKINNNTPLDNVPLSQPLELLKEKIAPQSSGTQSALSTDTRDVPTTTSQLLSAVPAQNLTSQNSPIDPSIPEVFTFKATSLKDNSSQTSGFKVQDLQGQLPESSEVTSPPTQNVVSTSEILEAGADRVHLNKNHKSLPISLYPNQKHFTKAPSRKRKESEETK